MFILQNNELSERLISELKKINTLIDIKKSNQKKEIRQIISSMIRNLKMNAEGNAWKEFEMRFEQVHQSFYDDLIKDFPNLTPNEKKLCAFLRLDMSTKDISAITFQSVNSILVARTRLRKKLQLLNTDIDLNIFLSKY